MSDDATAQALVTVRGKFSATVGVHDDWMPFILRFYLYSGSSSIRLVQSIVYDGEAEDDFISGLGSGSQYPLKERSGIIVMFASQVRMAGT